MNRLYLNQEFVLKAARMAVVYQIDSMIDLNNRRVGASVNEWLFNVWLFEYLNAQIKGETMDMKIIKARYNKLTVDGIIDTWFARMQSEMKFPKEPTRIQILDHYADALYSALDSVENRDIIAVTILTTALCAAGMGVLVAFNCMHYMESITALCGVLVGYYLGNYYATHQSTKDKRLMHLKNETGKALDTGLQFFGYQYNAKAAPTEFVVRLADSSQPESEQVARQVYGKSITKVEAFLKREFLTV